MDVNKTFINIWLLYKLQNMENNKKRMLQGMSKVLE
jgi:hypothetical protein